jgi:hypothetical protein
MPWRLAEEVHKVVGVDVYAYSLVESRTLIKLDDGV